MEKIQFNDISGIIEIVKIENMTNFMNLF